MKKIAIATVAVLMLMSFVVKVEANIAMHEVLKVYDENGAEVGNNVANATTYPTGNIVNFGVPQTIKISAYVPSSITIRLSTTMINWNINKAGKYQTEAIRISGISTYGWDYAPQGGGDVGGWASAGLEFRAGVSMNVSGAENLKNNLGGCVTDGDVVMCVADNIYGPQSLPTYYALTPTGSMPPQPAGYQGAGAFNGTHQLYSDTSIWNKIDFTSALPGNYQDEFSVTFSQNL